MWTVKRGIIRERRFKVEIVEVSKELIGRKNEFMIESRNRGVLERIVNHRQRTTKGEKQ